MKKNTTTSSFAIASITFIFFAAILSLIVACRKTQHKTEVNFNDITREKFFKISPTVNPVVQAIQQSIKRQDKQRNFVPELSQKAGFPIWNKAMIADRSLGNNTAARVINDTGKVVLIPFVKGIDSSTNAVLVVNMGSATRDTTFNLIYASQYEEYGFDLSDTTKANARNILHLFMVCDNEIFGYTEFTVHDLRIITGQEKDTVGQTYVTLVDGHGNSYENRMINITFCNDVDVCNSCGARTSARMLSQGCPCGSHLETFCTSLWVDIGNGGGGMSGGTNPPEGGGGGGNWEDENPCRAIPGIDNPCSGSTGSGNTGWTADEDPLRDENGYLYSRIAELLDTLANNPFAITPCDSLNIMPLEIYGPMYQRVYQYELPQALQDRIDSLSNVIPDPLLDGLNQQYIENASGASVNCDYFPVKISQLPTGFNAESLLEYFRTHINDFITSPVTCSFDLYSHDPNSDPYTDPPAWVDSTFAYPYNQSIGGLVSIYLQAPESGTVIESEYYHSVQIIGSNIHHNHRFKFTTLSSPLDGLHPVSGHREFGVFTNPGNPSELVFYTMGVDRTAHVVSSWLNAANSLFEKADKLWSNIQGNFIEFINGNGGTASYYSPKKIIARPKWKDVRDFLKGLITFEQLKAKLGC